MTKKSETAKPTWTSKLQKEKKELLELQSTNGTYVTFQTSNSNLQMISAPMFLKKKKLNPRDKQIDMKNTQFSLSQILSPQLNSLS